jgi:hypothetical protein
MNSRDNKNKAKYLNNSTVQVYAELANSPHDLLAFNIRRSGGHLVYATSGNTYSCHLESNKTPVSTLFQPQPAVTLAPKTTVFKTAQPSGRPLLGPAIHDLDAHYSNQDPFYDWDYEESSTSEAGESLSESYSGSDARSNGGGSDAYSNNDESNTASTSSESGSEDVLENVDCEALLENLRRLSL